MILARLAAGPSRGGSDDGSVATDFVGITTVGVGDRTRELLQQLLQRAGSRFRLAAPAHARIAVVDLDTDGSVDAWAAMRHEHPALDLVCLATRCAAAPDGVTCVGKPIDPNRLLEAFNRCAGRTADDAAAVARRSGVELRSPVAGSMIAASLDVATTAVFDPDLHLASVARDALASARRGGVAIAVELANAPHRRIVFDADAGGRAWVGIPSTLLHGLACTVGVRAQLRVQQCTAGDAPAHEWVEADSVIWALAAHAAHGRLPRGTDPRRHLRLRRWPNLTRWLETPGAMTLAAQWSRGASLAWLHRNSGVPCPAINTFYAAGAALDLFEEHGDGASGRWSRMASAASAPSNLLSRLARRLLGRD